MNGGILLLIHWGVKERLRFTAVNTVIMWRLRSASSVAVVVEIGPQDKVNALFSTFGPWARVPSRGTEKRANCWLE